VHVWLDAELKSPELHPANEEDRQKAGRSEEQGSHTLIEMRCNGSRKNYCFRSKERNRVHWRSTREHAAAAKRR